jgi:predicted dehydrogenase
MKVLFMKRRTFLAAAVTLPTVLPSTVFGAHKKLNIAFIGMGGQIQGHVKNAAQLGHNVVAFCDVDLKQITGSQARHQAQAGKVKAYTDYRQLLEKEKTLDAVVVATPDHWHAPICTAAMRAGLHVFCEKPLTHTIAEARALRELARQSKVVTQTGNQGSASSNLRRSIELIQAGLFGQISNVHVWHPAHGWPNGVPRPAGADAIPQGLNWDFWCGPAPVRPYKADIYHPAKWRGWYDFGNGSMGDFCCHSFNMPVRALKLGYPTRVEISKVKKAGMESYAQAVTHTFHFAAQGNRAAVNLIYYTGGEDMPPKPLTDQLVGTFGSIPRVGAIVEGEHGLLNAGLWNSQCYVKMKGDKKFVGHGRHAEAVKVEQRLPRVAGHFQEWTDAILGNGKTFSPFEFGGQLTEIGLSGIVALKLQRNLEWDGQAMKAKGVPEADALVRKQNRSRWL